MGTNYYLITRDEKCNHCNRPYIPRQIGKDSHGWAFALRVYPEDNINDIDDWIKLWTPEDMIIMDEYGKIIDKDFMRGRIVNKISLSRRAIIPSKQVLEQNYAIYDTDNDLLRADVNRLAAKYGKNTPCLANGKGTYDIFVGEFS